MTKISKKLAYPIKDPVRKDYFVGTDSENNGKTVNFDFESTAKLINELNGTPILNYIFKTSDNIPLEVLTDGTFLSEGNETTLSSISKLYINKKNFNEEDMSDLFRFISLNREVFVMKLRNSSNLANGVYFKITGATEFQDHFTLEVAIEIANTAVPELINFNIYFFDFELKSSDLAINLPEFNKIVTETGYTSTGTQITFNALWVWLIKNVSYSNAASVTKTIAPTSTGNKRIDVFVLNASNTFQTISGAETTGSPVKPQIPFETIEVTFCIVGDSGIETVEPINLVDYATIVYVDTKDVLLSNRITVLENAPDIDISGKENTANKSNSVADIASTTKFPVWKVITDWVTSLFAPINSPTFTGVPLAPTATVGTNDTQVANTAFVGNAIATADSGNVKTTGNQSITGVKSIVNTTPFINNGISLTNSGTDNANGVIKIINTNSSFGIYGLNEGSGVGNVFYNTNNGIGIQTYNSGAGKGLVAYNSGSGVNFLAENGNGSTGDNIVANNSIGGNGFNYVGRNNSTNTFTVDKLGAITGTKIINSTAPATNILLADGSTIAQSSIIGDVSGKENISNKSNSFTVSSTTTYASTKALVDGLASKVSNATHTGDATGATVLTLATVNSNVGSFGTASSVPQYTVNAKGLTTASANVSIQIAQSQVTSLTNDLGLKASLASPSFTGAPSLPTGTTAVTQTAGTNTTQIATTAFVLANSSNIPQLESNATDLTVWNNGKGNNLSSTSFGDLALRLNSSGVGNTAFGYDVLSKITTSSGNTGVGSLALSNAISLNNVTAIGQAAGQSFNVNSPLTNASSSLFIGGNSRALGDSQTNQIVIGVGAVGAGSNTATLGDTNITSTILRGTVSGDSFVKKSAPSTNLLLAGGGDIAQSSFIGGSGTTNFLPKFTSSGTVGNSIIFDNGTNIGIGTTNPQSLLQLTASTPNIIIDNQSASTFGGIQWATNGNTLEAFIQQQRSSGEFRMSAGRSPGWGGIMTFYTDTSERMRINSTGKVIINDLSGPNTRIVTANASGQLSATTIPVFADNTAAIAGGLGVGALYRTVIGLLAVVF